MIEYYKKPKKSKKKVLIWLSVVLLIAGSGFFAISFFEPEDTVIIKNISSEENSQSFKESRTVKLSINQNNTTKKLPPKNLITDDEQPIAPLDKIMNNN